MRLISLVAVSIGLSLAASPSADHFAREAEKAEKAGETVRAYLLYAQAALADRKNPVYWAKAESLRPRAEAQATVKLPTPELTNPGQPPAGRSDIDSVQTFTAQDLQDLERMTPPPRLRPSRLMKSFHLEGDSKSLFEQVAKEFGYIVIFDRDYNPAGKLRFNVSQVEYREALHALEEASNSFIVPISETAMLIAQDTQQKRTELENDEALGIPIPQRTSVQEAQELLTLVQQTLEIRRAVLDPQRRMIILRDRVAKVETAQAILNELVVGKPQVSIEIEFLSAGVSSSLSLGLNLPTQFPLVDFGNIKHAAPSLPAGFMRFLTFGAGKTFFGIGITDAQMFATASRASATSLLRSTVTASDGQPATLHVGDKYPIVTGGYYGFGNVPGGSGVPGTPGSYTYAVLSTTPYADAISVPVSTTGRMELVVNAVRVPLVLPQGTNNLASLQTILNSLGAGVIASLIQRGTNNKPLSLVLSASTLGITSIQLIDDPDGANIKLLRTPDVVSAITLDIPDATQSKVSQNGTLSLTVGAAAFPITLTSDTNNLIGLRDAINAAKAGVTAAVLAASISTPAVYLQVVADSAGSGVIQLYDDPNGANLAVLTPTDQLNQAGSQFGQTVSGATGGSTGTGNIGQIYTPPPTFTFEDLGLILKITPFIHSLEEVTLEVEAEFKVLGSGSFNGVPVISVRKFQGKLRLKTSEWAVVAGLVSDTRSKTSTGIAGLMNIPGLGVLLRDNERTHEESNLLIVIKPQVTSLPASEFATRTIWVGSETRTLSPL